MPIEGLYMDDKNPVLFDSWAGLQIIKKNIIKLKLTRMLMTFIKANFLGFPSNLIFEKGNTAKVSSPTIATT